MAVDLANVRDKGPLGAVATLALLRADELIRKGHPARLADDYDFKFVEGAQEPALAPDTRAEFDRLRAEADAWKARRDAFMLPKLRAGRHSDTDPTFWQGWNDGPPIQLSHHWIAETFGAAIPWTWVTLGFVVVGIVLAGALASLALILRAGLRWIVRWRSAVSR